MRIAPRLSKAIGALRRFFRARQGSVTVTSAFSIVMIFGFAALAVDGGSLYYRKRALQTAVDLAALAAAADVPNARRAAIATLAANGFDAAVLVGLDYGIYQPLRGEAPDQRFRTAPPVAANAVRLSVVEQRRTIFAPVLALAAGPDSSADLDTVRIRAVATATSQNTAAFALGSRLLSLDGGVLNAILGSMLGTTISLSVMDYNALVGAHIDLFSFSQALAARTQLTAGTYEDLLGATVKSGDVLGALADAAVGPAASALRLLSRQMGSGTPSVILNRLISVGPYKSLKVGEVPPITASVEALGIVSALAQLANGDRIVDVTVPISLPGVIDARLRLAIGERPVNSPMVSVGPEGASVHTAQTRLLLTVRLLGTGAVSVVTLPLYVEVAAATARVSAITCPAFNPSATTVTLGVTPAIVDAWIGDVSMAEFRNMSVRPNPPAATLVSLIGIANVTARAHVAITNMSERPVTFGMTDIRNKTPRTVSTTDFTTSLVTRLLRDLQLGVTVIGLPLLVPPGLTQLVAGILSGATTVLDQLLRAVLSTLGIRLGSADAWVTGVRCGQPVLIG